MIARQRRRMQERAGALMTIDTRQTRLASARATLATWAALLLTTLGVLVGTVTSTAAQALTRGPVLIETHHTDLAGNIRLSTNEAGVVTQRLDYAPFGEVDNRPCGPTNDPTPAPQFQGKLRDPKTCLDDFGARDYYMVTGRFQSVDPVLPVETALRDPQQWNRYAYARNNPLIYTDPDGREVRGDEECGPACPVLVVAAPAAAVAMTTAVAAVTTAIATYPVVKHVINTVTVWMASGEAAVPDSDGATADETGASVAKGVARGGESAAAAAGRRAHSNYGAALGEKFDAKVTLPSGRKPDAVDWANRQVRELKPDNGRAVARGQRQVEGYRKELEMVTGERWTSVVDIYRAGK
jgi:RHS repeat-associated protein